MAIILPLDLEYWFVNIFSGSIEIFALLGLLVITSMAAYFRMNEITFGIFIMMFAVILNAVGFNAFLILGILIFAPIIFWWIRRLVE